MKKIYIKPSVKLANAFAPQIIATSGGASEIHEGDGTKDTETTPDMKGTGGDDDFTLHTKYRSGFYE